MAERKFMRNNGDVELAMIATERQIELLQHKAGDFKQLTDELVQSAVIDRRYANAVVAAIYRAELAGRIEMAKYLFGEENSVFFDVLEAKDALKFLLPPHLRGNK